MYEHLREVGETYPQHLRKATGFGTAMLAGGIACLLHGLLPFLFVKTGSDCIRRLHGEMVENRKMVENRNKRPAAQAPNAA